MTTSINTASAHRSVARPPAGTLVASALGFVAFYLANDLVTPNFASSALPLPNASGSVVKEWFATNQAAAILSALLQVLSVACLAVFAVRLRALEPTNALQRIVRVAFAATGMMVVSSGYGLALAALAPTASVGTVEVLRSANFIAGGTAHVVALGLFAMLASRAAGVTKPLRVLAYVVFGVAVLSLSSLVVFQGAAFILLARLLGMVWVISVAASVVRGRSLRAGR